MASDLWSVLLYWIFHSKSVLKDFQELEIQKYPSHTVFWHLKLQMSLYLIQIRLDELDLILSLRVNIPFL